MSNMKCKIDLHHRICRSSEIRNHGNGALNRLLGRYTDINADEARGCFTHFKLMCSGHREKKLQEMCKHILLTCQHTYPQYWTLAAISTTIPLSSVPCERNFSSQNIIHSCLRNALTVQSVENKMFVKQAARREDYDEHQLITNACARFSALKTRRQ